MKIARYLLVSAIMLCIVAGGAFAQVPSWAIGTFTGRNDKYKSEVELTISARGRVTVRNFNDSGKRDTQSGDYRNGEFSLDGQTYTVDRTSNGVRTTQVGDKDNTISFRRGAYNGGSDNGGDTRPSDWSVGTFNGYNGRYNQDRELTISRNGRAVMTARNRSTGKRETYRGDYRSGKLVLDGERFTLERTRAGVRVFQDSDRSNSTSMTRNGSDDGGGRPDPVPDTGRTGPPNWLVGTFRGHNNKYNSEDELVIDSSGGIALNSVSSKGKRTTSSGFYGRDGRIHIASVVVAIEKRGSGFRSTQIDEPDNTMMYSRR